MSKISDDDRTASQEISTVLLWSFIMVLIISVLCIATALWAFGYFHFLTLGA